MRIGIVRERIAGERRVALVPDAVMRLCRQGFEVSSSAVPAREHSMRMRRTGKSEPMLSRKPRSCTARCSLCCGSTCRRRRS